MLYIHVHSNLLFLLYICLFILCAYLLIKYYSISSIIFSKTSTRFFIECVHYTFALIPMVRTDLHFYLLRQTTHCI